jgi:hypothetical protein
MTDLAGGMPTIPADVPLPTADYSEHQAEQRARSRGVRVTQMAPIAPPAAEGPAPMPDAGADATRIPRPFPFPLATPGARVLIFKQDPSVSEIGVRKAFLPKKVFAGPQDARIAIAGLPSVAPNVFGDLLVDPVANPVAFDSVHTFAIVRMTLTMYQRALGAALLPWQWNTGGNTDVLSVFPHAGVTQNAFYSRTAKALKFFFFDSGTPPQTIFTCRSLDIVAHETGHAVLDALKPGWLLSGNPPQTGGLHESFGDLTAIFLTLSQLDQCESVIAQTKANLHARNFLVDLAEQFGLALGRPNGLRNADNDLKLSEVGTEVHAISQVFTGGVFDVLADLFAIERDPAHRDDAVVLHDVSAYMASLVLRAIQQAPASGATYADVVNKMLALVVSDGKPAAYRAAIVTRFAVREVVSPSALALDGEDAEGEVEAGFTDPEGAVQDRAGCCGTMQLDEYIEDETSLEEEIAALAEAFK